MRRLCESSAQDSPRCSSDEACHYIIWDGAADWIGDCCVHIRTCFKNRHSSVRENHVGVSDRR
jgi:hypothetical protein